MKKKICAVVAISCAIAIIGAIGSSDLGTMNLSRLLSICSIAGPLLVASTLIGGFLE